MTGESSRSSYQAHSTQVLVISRALPKWLPGPSGAGRELPGIRVVRLPPKAYQNGELIIEVRKSGKSNVVMSDIWIDAVSARDPSPRSADPNGA